MIYLWCTRNPTQVKKLDHHIDSKADEGLLKVQERLARMKVVMDAYKKQAVFYSLTKVEAMPMGADEERLVPSLGGTIDSNPRHEDEEKKGGLEGLLCGLNPGRLERA